MDCLERHAAVRDALERDLGVVQQGADRIVALLDSDELALAVDTAAIREAQGRNQAVDPGFRCPITELIGWGDRIAAVQARLQEGRDLVARLRSENLALRQELTRDLR